MEETNALAVIESSSSPPIISSYNEQIRPLMDAVHKLRLLNVMNEGGIHLPTIVLLGDQSPGKSTVLESLTGISLPRGQGICTPFITRLQQDDPTPNPVLTLEYLGMSVVTDEARVVDAINSAAESIAGTGKGMSRSPLTLVVKKDDVPDLTIIDLPDITRETVEMIREYISPQETIILNVVPANVDFSTCESIKMSREADKTGERTLVVITEADKSPEGLIQEVATHDIGTGLGCELDRSPVGISVLAQKLTRIQAAIIAKQINDKLSSNIAELNKLPNRFSSVVEAMIEFGRITRSAMESLRKILVRGEYEEYPDAEEMHFTARFAEMLNEYSQNLGNSSAIMDTGNFLMEEIEVLQGICAQNSVPRSAFLSIMQRKVNAISAIPGEFVEKVWRYVEKIVLLVLDEHSKNYPDLQYSTRRAARNLLSKKKAKLISRVKEMVEMERVCDYTCDPEHVTEWNKFMESSDAIFSGDTTHLDGIGPVEMGKLREQYSWEQVRAGFGVRMRTASYWRVVQRRMVDCTALHLTMGVHELADREVEEAINEEFMHGRDYGRLMEESPSLAGERERLEKSIELLKEMKDLVDSIMD